MNTTLITTLDLAAENALAETADAEQVVGDAVKLRMQSLQLRDPALAAVLATLGRGLKAASDLLDQFADHAESEQATEHAAEYRELVGGIDEALDRIDAAINTLDPDALNGESL
jgi:hypothetical protein